MDTIVSQGTKSRIVVETRIEGEGSTYTHVENEINGQKQVFETTEPGKYELNWQSSPEPNQPMDPDSSEATSSPKSSPDFTQLKRQDLFQRIRNYLASFISRWL